ncbi:hypothetical protein GOB94_09325 [Granulicella sp. 5B5]|uniref:hypothetical protein n=1 Tax=Granulicella sp. 5B5 TaxID=1617967 RepID=UPI0015F69701|nr:hypothetical protein [Granulicella sp. 5B5]QMV18860.1 hypothetical protein GOB94_09325 [Granulicella sp. 5B5]
MGFIRRPARSVPSHRRFRGLAALAIGSLFAAGCASPGPPRAPSLNLPQPVSDLTVSRTGNTVELRFTVPHRSTDKLPLYNPRHHHTTLHGTVCRGLTTGSCTTVATLDIPLTATDPKAFIWHESLPTGLTTGQPHPLRYQVEFLSPQGKSAGPSNTAFTATGPAPAPVEALRATGTRSGALLDWSSTASGDVLLHRTALAPTTKHTTDLWLNANSANRTLDATVTANAPYRYTAERRLILTFGTHTVELRSIPSTPIDFTLRPIYPPATPTSLAATGFTPPATSGSAETPHYAIDLIWQPVSDADTTPTLAAPLTGYNIYREPADGSSARTRLNQAPVPEPSFHDPTADPATTYRYSVTAVDGNNNESKAATVLVEPSPQ